MENSFFEFFGNRGSALCEKVYNIVRIIETRTNYQADTSAHKTNYAICPLIDSHDEINVYRAILSDLIPIVISDNHRLICECSEFDNILSCFYCNSAEYRFCFRLGSSLPELFLLEKIISLPDIQQKRLKENGKQFIKQVFNTYDREKLTVEFERLNNIKLSQYFLTEGNDCIFDFPVFNDEGCILTERDIFCGIWNYFCTHYPAEGKKSILIFGAGKFLRRMLKSIQSAGFNHSPNISAITDDSISSQTHLPYKKKNNSKRQNEISLYGYRLVSVEDSLSLNFSAIFVATDFIEDILEKRCKELYGYSIPILKISELLNSLKNKSVMRQESQNISLISIKEYRPPEISDIVFGDDTAKKIECVIVCVNYGDFLSFTLPYNIENFDKIVVVTSPDDKYTISIAEKYNAEIVISDVYKANGAPFNKGKMINAGIKKLDRDGWILITDADIFIRKNIKRRIFNRLLNPDCLYYALRLHAPENNLIEWLERFSEDESICSGLHFSQPGDNRMPWGYFQLFHSRSKFLKNRTTNKFYPENFPTAGEVDYYFQDKWDDVYKILLPETVVHIPHGKLGSNWQGRRTPFITGACTIK